MLRLHRMTAARRAYTRKRVFGCGSCEACQTYASSMEVRPSRQRIKTPSVVKRSRLSYGACEHKIETECATCGLTTEREQDVGDLEWYCAACVADWENECEE
jgi:hypothetical protein